MKKHKSILLYSFVVGLVIGSIPSINRLKESLKVKKLIEEQRNRNSKQKKICKEDNSDYKKFLIWFPKTTIENSIIVWKNNERIQKFNIYFYDLFC